MQREARLPSGGDVVGVWRPRADLSGQAKVCYLYQLRPHAQQVLRLHVPVEETWQHDQCICKKQITNDVDLLKFSNEHLS